MQPLVRVYAWTPRLHRGLRASFSTSKATRNLQQEVVKLSTFEQDPQRRRMGMWLANDSNALDSSKILQELPRLSSAIYEHIHLAVFMVTPQFAHLVDESSPFLESAMSSIFGPQPGLSTGATFRSVVGIVDKLPGHKFGPRSGAPPACEGVAYLLSYGGNVDTEPEGDTTGADAPPSVVRWKLRPGRVQPPAEYRSTQPSFGFGNLSIAAPLANTLFINGRRSTLTETLWTKSVSGNFARGSSTALSAVNIRINHGMKGLRRRIPLHQLAPERTVTSALGNVLRSVEMGGVDAPASKELEEVIAERPLEAHADGSRPQIYAAVISKSRPDFGEGIRPTSWTLFSGMGLYRLSGGGGGWGQKQGLLSLDPTRTYTPGSSETAPTDSVDMSNDDMPDILEPPDFLGSRQSLVHTGDRVTFWAEYTDTEQLAEGRAFFTPKALGWNEGGDQQSLLLGTIPRPEKDAERLRDGHDNIPVVTMKGTFGLLSEKGVALECDGFIEAPITKDHGQMNEPSKNVTEESSQRFHHQVVVEVPGAWFGSRCWGTGAEKVRMEKDAKKLGSQQLHESNQPVQQQEPVSYEALIQDRTIGGRAAGLMAKAAQGQGKQEDQQSQQNVRRRKRRDAGPSDVIFNIDVPQPDEFVSHEENESKGGYARLDQPLADDSGPGQAFTITRYRSKPVTSDTPLAEASEHDQTVKIRRISPNSATEGLRIRTRRV